MKKLLPFLLVMALGLVNCSQERENMEEMHARMTAVDEVERSAAYPWPDDFCRQPPCAERMPALRAYYQTWADATGQSLKMRVPCCYEGRDIWLTLEVYPKVKPGDPEDLTGPENPHDW